MMFNCNVQNITFSKGKNCFINAFLTVILSTRICNKLIAYLIPCFIHINILWQEKSLKILLHFVHFFVSLAHAALI